MMSRKHYVEIAKIIKTSGGRTELIVEFIRYFKEDNSRFDEDKFFEACGV